MEIQRESKAHFQKNVLKWKIPAKNQEIPGKILDRILRKQREILGNHKYLEKF